LFHELFARQRSLGIARHAASKKSTARSNG